MSSDISGAGLLECVNFCKRMVRARLMWNANLRISFYEGQHKVRVYIQGDQVGVSKRNARLCHPNTNEVLVGNATVVSNFPWAALDQACGELYDKLKRAFPYV